MSKARRVMIALSKDVAGAADEVAAKRECSRSALVEDALRWYLRSQTLPVEQPTPEERAVLAAGRAQHARGEFVTLDEVRRELAADLLAERPKKSAKASA